MLWVSSIAHLAVFVGSFKIKDDWVMMFNMFGECLTRGAFQQHWRSARQLPTDECCPDPGAGKVEGKHWATSY